MKEQAMRVWWKPQVPCKSFYVDVGGVSQAAFVLRTLARYDMFQLRNGIKPDFCNAGGLHVFDESDYTDSPQGSWVEWEDECGNGIHEAVAVGTVIAEA